MKQSILMFVAFFVAWLLLIVLVFTNAVKWRDEVVDKIEEPQIISGSISIDQLSTAGSPNIIIKTDQEPELRYGFTDEDIYLMAQLLCGSKDIHGDGEYDFVWGHMQGEMNYYEMSKVLCVIMNRVRNDHFPDTVYDVITQPGQFVDARNIYTIPDDIAIDEIRKWCESYDNWDFGVQCIPENHLFYDGDGRENHTRETWR